MHVRSSGDPVEITGERDNLAISCDQITHAVDMLMSMCKLGNSNHHCENSNCRDCAEEAGCLATELTHVFAEFCMTVWDDCIVLRALGLEFCMRLFHDPWYT